ncbi:hypothetical protein AeMF1_003800 [Aphanomyces euteiches]|nr:hypothetical protein AeMF1_003800 [Aphanomyces euteiches]KAH9189144.1 hypothetical protein AeNC1_008887 [Aphanomyces euteiches]
MIAPRSPRRWNASMRSNQGQRMCSLCTKYGVLAVALGGFVDLYVVQTESCKEQVEESSEEAHLPFAKQLCIQSYLHEAWNDTDIVVTCVYFVGNTLLVGALGFGPTMASQVSLIGFRIFGGLTSVVVHHAFTTTLAEAVGAPIIAIESMDTSSALLIFDKNSAIGVVEWMDRCTSVRVQVISSPHVLSPLTALSYYNEGATRFVALSHASGLDVLSYHKNTKVEPKKHWIQACSIIYSKRDVLYSALAWTATQPLTLCGGTTSGSLSMFQVHQSTLALVQTYPSRQKVASSIHYLLPLRDKVIALSKSEYVVWPLPPPPLMEAMDVPVVEVEPCEELRGAAIWTSGGAISLCWLTNASWSCDVYTNETNENPENQTSCSDDVVENEIAEEETPPLPMRTDTSVERRYALPQRIPSTRHAKEPQMWTKQAYRHRLEQLQLRVDAMSRTVRGLHESFRLFTDDVNDHMATITLALQRAQSSGHKDDEPVAATTAEGGGN